MNPLMTFAGVFTLATIGAPAHVSAGAPEHIHWVKTLGIAERQATAHKKLVLEFLLLGDLTDPHC